MKQVMLGNEAIARGAYEAGCSVASAYPGTPSTEILQNLSKYKEVYSEWSVNEKVAAEVAIGASMAGARAMAAMKHFGMNVASDAVFPSVYIGATGGLVYICADDPGMNSSGTEPDSRHFAPHMKMPMLEPADSQECKDYTKLAFDLSEQYDTPVMVRTTVRVNHGSSIVSLADRVEVPVKHYERNIMKNTNIPAMARNKHKTVEERLVRLREYANATPLNRMEMHDTKIGVICSGICYQYAREVFGEGASYLKLGFTYPMPDKLIREFAKKVDNLIVLEELDPIVEDYVKSLGIPCTGKDVLPLYLEYSADIIRRAFGLPTLSVAYKVETEVPVRPASYCAGCPHRGIYHEVSKYNGKIVATGDIGCYALNINPPFSVTHTQIDMGGSITAGHGFERVERQAQRGLKVFSFIGDSTFFHSGITGLINAVYNGAKTSVFILDNSTTGMTGHQDNPGSGRTLQGDIAEKLRIEDILAAYGYKNIIIVDPQDLTAMEKAVQDALASEVPAAIITRRPCLLIKRIKHDIGLCSVDTDKCIGCKMCLKVACPAITVRDKKACIDPIQCVGCTVCAQVCPRGAISRKEN